MNESTRVSTIFRLDKRASAPCPITTYPSTYRGADYVYHVSSDLVVMCAISELDSRIMTLSMPSEKTLSIVDSYCRKFVSGGDPIQLPATKELRSLKSKFPKGTKAFIGIAGRIYDLTAVTNAARSLGYEDTESTPCEGWSLRPDGILTLRKDTSSAAVWSSGKY